MKKELVNRVLSKLEELEKEFKEFEKHMDNLSIDSQVKCDKCNKTMLLREDFNYCPKCGTKLTIIDGYNSEKIKKYEKEFIKNFLNKIRKIFSDENINPEKLIDDFLKSNGMITTNIEKAIEYLEYSDLSELIEFFIDGIEYVNSEEEKFFIENFYVNGEV